MIPLVPLYVHPLEDPAAWQAAAACGSALTVVVNVHNGPGTAPEDAYLRATQRLADAGVGMLGYIHLGYGARPLAEVADDMARWRMYPVTGALLDCAPADGDATGQVALAVRACRRAGLGTVVLNPGTRAYSDYHGMADGVGTFEGPWSQYRDWLHGRDWPNACHMVYGVPPADTGEALSLLQARGAGWGVVTDLDHPLPWQGLPRCLDEMVAVCRN